MRLRLADRIGDGTFADIFSPSPGDRAYKVFRRIGDPAVADVAPHVFDAETAAYRIAVEHPRLRAHVPAYFGPITVAQVCDAQGTDVSDRYWLHLSYAMQRLARDPDERKVGSFFNSSEWHLMKPLVQVFEGAGIDHLGDASVFYWKTDSPVLIDFATSDAAGDHARIIPRH